jgi:hypothetical protein
VVEIIISIGAYALVLFGILLFAKFFPIIPISDEKEGQLLQATIEIGRRRVPAVFRE